MKNDTVPGNGPVTEFEDLRSAFLAFDVQNEKIVMLRINDANYRMQLGDLVGLSEMILARLVEHRAVLSGEREHPN